MYTVYFGEKNSYKDWGLILTEKSIEFPEPKTKSVDAMGIDGEIDLTEVTTGGVQFNNRVLSFTFVLIEDRFNFSKIISEISERLHGKKMRITISFDAKYYYIGRCKINEFQTDRNTATIVIDCDCEPYKRLFNGYGPKEEWLWDSFDFEEDEIRYLGEIKVEGTCGIEIVGEAVEVVPAFLVSELSGTGTLQAGGKHYQLAAGRNRFPEFRIGKESVVIQFSGNFKVAIDYQGRRL